MKVLYVINCDAVRNVCVDNNWYTAGSNEDYCKMFDKVRIDNGVHTVEDIFEIAADIAAHTDMHDELTLEKITAYLLNVAHVIAVAR